MKKGIEFPVALGVYWELENRNAIKRRMEYDF